MELENKRVLVVFGTRPEAIKMSPLVKALQALTPSVSIRVCVTAQHRHMLDQALSLFGIVPDWDLDLMRHEQDLTDITAGVLAGLRSVLDEWSPNVVLVQGDTISAFATALAAFYQKIPVGHVEAGLRSGNPHAPWPEEVSRKLITALSTYHFAPTESARSNLLNEGVSDGRIWVTGNTVIDALMEVVTITRSDPAVRLDLERRFAFLDSTRRLLVVTAHRRESFGGPIESTPV